jgi:RNA-binding protein YlmH
MQKLEQTINNVLQMDNAELESIIEAIKQRRNWLASQASRKFVRGDRVSFEGKGGFPLTGTIEKIKIKYVLVHADNGQRWNVPGNRLTSVKAEA